jgi:hypothetical protein
MTTRRGSTVYPHIRRAEQGKQLDRDTWAGQSLLIFAYDTVGAGVIETELLDFGIVFEGPPFFTYGAEVQPGETLISGDFPEVTAGVREWHTSEVAVDDRAIPFYLGAYLWINIRSGTAYRLRFRLSFEGTAMRNVEYLRG